LLQVADVFIFFNFIVGKKTPHTKLPIFFENRYSREGKPHVPDFLHLHAVKEKYSCNFAN
jgi:hypothetical protein